MEQPKRTTWQWTPQDQRLSDLERFLADGARLIEESKREVKRSQGLLRDQEVQDARGGKTDDLRTG